MSYFVYCMLKYCLRCLLCVVPGPISHIVIQSPIPSSVRVHSSVGMQSRVHVSVRRSDRDIEDMLRSHNPSKCIHLSKMSGDLYL